MEDLELPGMEEDLLEPPRIVQLEEELEGELVVLQATAMSGNPLEGT